MHGTISLQSRLDHGTIAMFSIPFNKPQFQGATAPLVDIGPLPDRFQSELSVSCNTSSRGSTTKPGVSTPPLRSHAGLELSSVEANIKKPSASANPSHAQLTEAQKKDFHVLVVEDNAINQQIALKTIRSLGFSVSAVWNGKEALDYLLKATETAQSANPASTLTCSSTPSHRAPLPNVILMDVQMPILDGYRATHTLRHHAPFKDIQAIQKIPIVAMTASAIQGDREKCKRAGMDDYISKPTPRIKLEKIILKWAEGAASILYRNQCGPEHSEAGSSPRPDLDRCSSGNSFDCPGRDYPSREEQKSPTASMDAANTSALHQKPAQHHQRPNLTSPLSEEKVKSLYTAGEPNTALTEADRGRRRAEAEEQAASLRDKKLLAATEIGPYANEGGAGAMGRLGGNSPLLVGSASAGLPFSSSSPLGGGGESYSDQRAASEGNPMALTEENVERFNAEKGDNDAMVPDRRPTLATATSTNAVGGDLATDMERMSMMDMLLSPPLVQEGATAEELVERANPMDRFATPSSYQQRQQQQRVQAASSSGHSSHTRERRLSTLDRKGSDWSQTTARPWSGNS